jgi:hypothetical protein
MLSDFEERINAPEYLDVMRALSRPDANLNFLRK